MSSIKLLARPVSKWIVPRRSIHVSAITRSAAEPETEAAAARKYQHYKYNEKETLNIKHFFKM